MGHCELECARWQVLGVPCPLLSRQFSSDARIVVLCVEPAGDDGDGEAIYRQEVYEHVLLRFHVYQGARRVYMGEQIESCFLIGMS